MHTGHNIYHKNPFLVLLAAFIPGIICGDIFPQGDVLFYPLAIITIFMLVWLQRFRSAILRHMTDLMILLTLFSCGLLLAKPPDFPTDFSSEYELECRCREMLNQNGYILTERGYSFYLNSSQADHPLLPGEIVSFRARLAPLTENSNTGEFSYNRYLKQKGVVCKVIPVTPIRTIGHATDPLARLENLRQDLIRKIERLLPDTTQQSLVSALCLGYRNDLSASTQQLFTATGTIHLLSVSGLHTGAIFLLLTSALRLTGLSRRMCCLLTLPLLWGYACLTGLPPSVIRAATILSFITFSELLGRDYTPLNAIAASAFFTLLAEPLALGSLSFLMSYSAYTGIVLLYPYLNGLFGKLPWVPARIWSSCSVTFAAQLPTLPVSAYYFHTINLNSFLVNLIAVPIATLLLYSSVILLLLPEAAAIWMAYPVSWLCSLLLGSIQLFLPVSYNITDLYPSAGQIILIYCLMTAAGQYLITHNHHALRYATTFAAMLIIYCSVSNFLLSRNQEVAIFNIPRHSAILINSNGRYSFLFNTAPGSKKTVPYILMNKLLPFPSNSGVMCERVYADSKEIHTDGQTIRIVSPGSREAGKANILLITDNITPEEIYGTDSVQSYPSRIITDGSVPSFCSRKWKKFCNTKAILYQNTTETGTVTLSLK